MEQHKNAFLIFKPVSFIHTLLRLRIEKLGSILDLGRLHNPSTGRELIRLIIIDYITLVRDFAFLDWISGKMPAIHLSKGNIRLRGENSLLKSI